MTGGHPLLYELAQDVVLQLQAVGEDAESFVEPLHRSTESLIWGQLNDMAPRSMLRRDVKLWLRIADEGSRWSR